MENKAHALMAGIFTIALLIAAALIAMWFNRDREERIPYEIATNLSVPGLNPQAAVRYRGLDVGRVNEVLFDPEQPGRILIRFGVSKNTPITNSTFATLSYQGVTGLAYVQLDDTGRDPTLLPSSKNKVARIELRPGLLDTLQLRGLAILRQTEEVAQKLNTFLSDDNQKKMIAAFTDVSEAADKIATIPDKLQPALDEFPALTRNANQMVISLNKLSDDATVLTGNLNTFATRLNAEDGPLAGFSGAVDNVGSAASVIEYQAVPLINETKTSMRALNRTLENFNQRPQSILFGNGAPQPGPGEPGFRAP
ncbi:MlaD family protein [Oxalicibacterium faecigallinarum]|uniref:ABC transporter substrate-binding protein n=1 Tax=Oxalicibacterium faecigallinarum TaxID=573741 RepID=A0A8J3AVE9_9BURK|nr:MlaD family protein [Oxalicibacterium faecigallinarum]GGI19772.1 ABC transporter substrate-binding protein [Oxalicibacterium faecigallinarum]